MSTETFFDFVTRLDNRGIDDLSEGLKNARLEAQKTEREATQAFNNTAEAAGVASRSVKGQTDEAKKQLGIIEKLEKEYSELGKAVKKAQNTDDIKKFRAEQEGVLKQMREIEKATAPAAKNGKDLETSFSGAGLSLSGMIPAIGAVAATTAVVGAGWEKIYETSEKVTEQLRLAEQLTGQQGDQLENTRSRAASLAATFDKDFNEVLIAANSLSQGFGIGLDESFQIIENGFIKGADASGEFLSSLREYPTQFANAGGSADEFVALLVDAEKRGIFSDKGIDAVKEFNLRVREQATSTRDALIALLGEQEAETLFAGINDGSISTIDALKQVSAGLDENTVSTNVLQTAVADVFGGAGEDAGLNYLQSLKDIDQVTQSLTGSNSKLEERQREQLRLNTLLAEAEGELAEAFGKTGESLNGIGTQLQILWVEFLTWLVTEIRETKDAFVDFYDESLKPIVDFFVDLYDQGVQLFSELLELIGLNSSESSAFLDLMVKGLTSFSTSLKVVLAGLSATIDLIRLVAGVTADAFGFAASFTEATFTLVVNSIKSALNSIIEAASEVKEFIGGDAIEFRFETAPVEFPDFQNFLQEQASAIGDFNDKQKDRFIGVFQEIVDNNKKAVEENKSSLDKLNDDTKNGLDKTVDAVESAREDMETIVSRDPVQITGDDIEGQIQIPSFEKTKEELEEQKQQLEETFAALQQGLSEIGGSLDEAIGVSGLDTLFGELSVFFAEELPEGVSKSEAAINAAAAGISVLSGALSQFYGQQIADNEAYIGALNDRIAEQEEAIQRESELAEEGRANNVEGAEAERNQLIQQRREAIEEQERLQRRQAIVEALTQASALATTAAQLFASQAPKGPIGVTLAVGALAAVLTSFNKFKRDARASVYAKKGHAEILGGNLHTQGGVTFEGEAERGEAFVILNRRATAKHGKDFINLAESLNAGKLPELAPVPAAIRTQPLTEAVGWLNGSGSNGESAVAQKLEKIEGILANWERRTVYRPGDIIEVRQGNKIKRIKIEQ